MMILGFVAFTMTDLMTPKSHHYAVLDIVAMLGMFNNLLPNPEDIIWPGPYWFFGLMLQLYLIFRLFIARRHWGWTVGLMVVCVVLQCCFGPESEELNRYRYNFMGGMLPFGLGILYARYGRGFTLHDFWPQYELYWLDIRAGFRLHGSRFDGETAIGPCQSREQSPRLDRNHQCSLVRLPPRYT